MDKSIRYCLKCRENTTFKRKKKDLHSICNICGSWKSAKRRDKIVQKTHRPKYKKIIDLFEIEEE